MILKHPWVLLLLLSVPLWIYLRYAARRRAALRFSDTRPAERLPPSPAMFAAYLLPVLYTAGLLMLVIALARPQKGLAESRVHTEGVDIVLLVDISTSMRAEDFSTPGRPMNRLDAAKEVLERFVKRRESDRIGLVAFAALPYTVAPLTLDHGWLLLQSDRLKTGMLEDGTAIGSAIGSAINRLRDSEAKSKVVVLLTDGVNNAGSLSPLNAAQAAKALGIKVYTIGAGSQGLVPFPVQTPMGKHYVRQVSEIDEATLKEIADITGGLYFRATDFKELAKIYDEIDGMEKTKIEVEQYTRFEERFMPFLFLALGFLGIEKLLSYSRIGRIP